MDERTSIAAVGEVTLLVARQWQQPLLQSLRAGRPAALDLSGAVEVDLPAVQLLLSARRSFAARNVEFSVSDPGGALQAACRRAGIEWSGGGPHA
jgi:anti-anti-sigma regulatory factor